jgi:predicted PurR-regulated permease PerM
MSQYKSHIFFFGLLLLISTVFYFVGEIVLPFIIGLLFAWILNPYVKRIQKKIPNRNAAVSTLLFLLFVFSTGTLWLFGNQIVHDFKRLNNAFVTFANDNSEEIDETEEIVKSYIEKIYPKKEVSQEIDFDAQLDSLKANSETIKESVSNVISFFGSSNEDSKEEKKGYNWFIIFISALVYFVYIIYSYPYFDERFNKYFGSEKQLNSYFNGLANDFNNTFVLYFKQRSKIVFISTLIFVISFLIIGIPGAIIFGVMAGLLCYISHFHYLSILPLSLGCWALSIEQDHSFFLFFGIVLGVLILVSVLEEFLFYPKFMQNFSNMNPAIMMVSLAVWSSVFGSIGILIGIPLTAVLLLYVDRMLMQREKMTNQ